MSGENTLSLSTSLSNMLESGVLPLNPISAMGTQHWQACLLTSQIVSDRGAGVAPRNTEHWSEDLAWSLGSAIDYDSGKTPVGPGAYL